MSSGKRINWEEITNKFINTLDRSKKYINSFLAGMVAGVGSVITMSALMSGAGPGALFIVVGIVLAVIILLTD